MSSSLAHLTELIRQLRDPENGCAWTKAQTLESLAPQTIEESYELQDAIASGQPELIKNELGDLLYHIVFYAELCQQAGWFNFDDIAAVMPAKHAARMPENHAQMTAEDINQHWQQQKKPPATLLASINDKLPPTERAYQLQQKAADVGFDWPATQPVVEKVYEELDELREEISASSEHIAEELGDLMFTCINLARHLGHHPNHVLAKANQKFIQRFNAVEQQCQQHHRDWQDVSLEQLEAYWQAAKKGS